MGPSEDQQRDAATERFVQRRDARRANIELIAQPGGVASADSLERVAKRLDRVSRYLVGERPPQATEGVAVADPRALISAALERAAPALRPSEVAEIEQAPEAAAGAVLERIINTADFVGARYLEAGVRAARAVGRVNIRDGAGNAAGFGTGSMVSPRLLLTNHHVLEDADVARASAIEFDFQDGLDGQPLQPKLFGLDPDSFFLADAARDFALVAVRGNEAALAPFGFSPLIEAEGKAIVGDFVTIVQHPRGQKKQVALRENRIVDVADAFLHYEADTEPGSSGSPVFNDQWEIVALHHASVPAPEHGELGGFLNEGIRISRILAFARAQPLPASARALLDGLALAEQLRAGPAGGEPPSAPSAPAPVALQSAPVADPSAAVRLTVPLEISLALGAPTALAPPARGDTAAAAPGGEAISIDPDFRARGGYDAAFLGSGATRVELPTLAPELMAKAATARGAAGAERHVLRYHHFSVVMNRERRLAFLTAVNIDGARSQRIKRERDRWFFDPRLPEDDQTGEAVYADNDLDRGHLVRRLDPAWADARAEAKHANDDTFHFTNCTPQHKRFNQNKTTWAGLEDYILDNADTRDFKVSVFTGPVFAADDDEYKGVRLPRQFWKVAVMVKGDGHLSATGYLLSQESLLAGLEADEEFNYGAYRTFQVPLARIEGLTGVDFGALADADPLARLEALEELREIERPDDLRL